MESVVVRKVVEGLHSMDWEAEAASLVEVLVKKKTLSEADRMVIVDRVAAGKAIVGMVLRVGRGRRAEEEQERIAAVVVGSYHVVGLRQETVVVADAVLGIDMVGDGYLVSRNFGIAVIHPESPQT